MDHPRSRGRDSAQPCHEAKAMPPSLTRKKVPKACSQGALLTPFLAGAAVSSWELRHDRPRGKLGDGELGQHLRATGVGAGLQLGASSLEVASGSDMISEIRWMQGAR